MAKMKKQKEVSGLTTKQVEALEALPLNQWCSAWQLNSASLRCVRKRGLVRAVKIEEPKTISDDDVKRGTITVALRELEPDDWDWPQFVMKVTNDYEMALQHHIAWLEKKVQKLEKQLVSRGINPINGHTLDTD